MAEFVQHLHPVWQALIRAVLLVIPSLLLLIPIIWWERRLLGWMQDRIGPNRVGNITFSQTSKMVPGFLHGKKFRLFGLAQPLADFGKLLFKEDITPSAIDRIIYFTAPAIALFPAFALAGTIPWGPYTSLTPCGDVNIGVLYIMAVSSLGVYGIVLAGYSANNKFSLMGGLRSSAQMISYELAMGMSLACIVMASGSLKPTEIVAAEHGPLWGFDFAPFCWFENWNILTPFGLVACLVFLVCMVAETNRAPFDLPEAENELVAGYHTEYSSMKFAVFFMGEYAAMFAYGLILCTLFIGGWHLLPIRFGYMSHAYPAFGDVWNMLDTLNGSSILAPVWFVGKGLMVITAYIWLRASMPRLRYDQLMSLGWKSLLPLATANLIVVAIWILATKLASPLIGWCAVLVSAVILYLLYKTINKLNTDKRVDLASREIIMVDEPPRRREVEMVDTAAAPS
ncbi:MAG: NADH-quinone oxidoreductase subunit H [Fimbriimonas sp.]|nr:NADH-quinone oxidoreductase subunit H [Fimbriimonas sp.]